MCIRDREQAVELLREMSIAAASPDVFTYDAALLACRGGQQQEQVVELLKDMQRRGIAPSAQTYESVTSACRGGAEYRNEAERLLREMSSGSRAS